MSNHRFARGITAATVLSVFACTSGSLAQDPPLNATLVGSWDGYTGIYSDVWGEGNYAYAPNFGLQDGNTARIHILNISDPAHPILDETFLIPSPNQFASPQDVMTGDGLLFVALEGAGVDSAAIIDIRNPQARSQVATVRIAGFLGIHNVFYDNKFLYMVDSATPRVGIVDLRNFDPDNPPPGPITQPLWMLNNVGTSFVHEVAVVNGRMYVAAWDSGVWVYDVSDVGNTAPVFLGSVAGNNTHSMWPTADGRFVVSGEERANGGIQVFEVIENGGSIDLQLRDAFVLSQSAYSVHNQVVIGNRLYNSWYQAGLQVFDIDCATGQLELVASFDTSAAGGGTGNFSGDWGVDPLLGEDRVLLSDMQTGFYIVDVNGPPLSFCYPQGRPTLVDPTTGTELRVQVLAASALPDLTSGALWVQVDGGPFESTAMTEQDGNLVGQLGPAACGSELHYYVSVDTLQGRPATSPVNAPSSVFNAVSAAGLVTIQSYNFENAVGWSEAGDAIAGHWETGVPAGDGTRGDPTADFDGSGKCFLTENLAGNSDVDNGSTQLLSPLLNLSGLAFPHVGYARWYSNDAGSAPEEDVFQVEIAGGGSWMPLETIGPTGAGVHGGWFEVVRRVPAGVSPLNDVRLRFTASDLLNASVVEAAIDAFAVYDLQCPGAAGCSGGTVEECCDLDSNGVRDDPCVWCACTGQTCSNIDVAFGDMGGSFGACPPDGFVNLFDRTHALTCFAGSNPCDSLNIDTGGAFGSCAPDGFCNIFDATHALTAFAGSSTCTCPGSPAPQPAVVAGAAAVSAVAQQHRIGPGDTVDVRVFLQTDGGKQSLSGYQLHAGASGGRRGRLELVRIAIEPRPDHVFAGVAGSFEAFNTQRGQMLAGLDAGEAAIGDRAYLASFTYRASSDAAGTFVVDLLHDEAAGDQTFLMAGATEQIVVSSTTPAIVQVSKGMRRP